MVLEHKHRDREMPFTAVARFVAQTGDVEAKLQTQEARPQAMDDKRFENRAFVVLLLMVIVVVCVCVLCLVWLVIIVCTLCLCALIMLSLKMKMTM